jgi:hypothetical protein
MTTRKQRAAAKRNIKKAARAARRKRTVARLPKGRAPLSVKRAPRLHERNGVDQGEIKQSDNGCIGLRRYRGIRIRQHRSYYVGLTTAIMFAAAGAMFVYRWLAAGSYLRPPFLPPLRELDLFRVFPRPPPPFFRPPRSDLFTVAQARRSASLALIPRFL